MRSGQVRVLWLIKGLGAGGAERLLVSVAGARSDQRFAYEAAYLLPHKDHLVGDLKSLGIPVHCLEAPRVSDPRWLRRCTRLIEERQIDIVHAHSPVVAGMVRPVVRHALRRMPPLLVYTEHVSWQLQRRPTRALNALTFWLDDAQISVSLDALQSIPRCFSPPVHIRHGVAVGTIRARRHLRDSVRHRLGVRPDEVVIGTVANYRASKDYPTLLRAARRTLDAGAPVRFLAIGHGPLENRVKSEHSRLRLGDDFRLLGYQKDPIPIMSAFDVFTLASSDEGLPVALMEALALGLPVVATSAGGVTEAIEHGREGLLVSPRNAVGLADALLKTARDPGLRQELASRASDRALDYDIGQAVVRIEAVYRSLLPVV